MRVTFGSAGRALLQQDGAETAAAPGSVTHEEVGTPEALVAALQAGVGHVLVVKHLDLTTLPPVAAGSNSSSNISLLLADRTKSIRGNCSNEELPSEDMLKHPRATASQCVLRTTSSFLEVPESTAAPEPHQLWLDNLYITYPAQPATAQPPSTPPTLVTVSPGSRLWMTNLALIGGKKEARGSSQQLAQVSRGMHVLEGAAVYARNITVAFHEWDGASAARLAENSTFAATDASFSNCVGTSVITTGPPSILGADGSAAPPAPSMPRSFDVSDSPVAADDDDYAAAPQGASGPSSAAVPAEVVGLDGEIEEEQGGAPVVDTEGAEQPPSEEEDDEDAEQETDDPLPLQHSSGGLSSLVDERERRPRPPRQQLLSAPLLPELLQRRQLFESSPPSTGMPSSWMWLDNVQFAQNNVEVPDSIEDQDKIAQIRSSGDSPAAVFSNQAHPYFDESSQDTLAPVPLTDTAFESGGFMSEQDEWFQATQSEAVDATGFAVLPSLDSSAQEIDAPVTEFNEGTAVRTRNTHGYKSHVTLIVPAIIAGMMVLVVAMVMLWRWQRSVRRKSKPVSHKKTFHGPLMPQSSARMPKLLKQMSLSINTNTSMVAAGSPSAAPALARTSGSFPFSNVGSQPTPEDEGNTTVSSIGFLPPSVIRTHTNGSFDAQATSEAHQTLSTPPSARQSRRGLFQLTPFNGSPSFGTRTPGRSNLSIAHTENNLAASASTSTTTPAQAAGTTNTATTAAPAQPSHADPGAHAVAPHALPSISHGSQGSGNSCYDTAAETLQEWAGDVGFGQMKSACMEQQAAIEATTVEITRSSSARPWGKRHLFHAGSRILGSRKGSISGHNSNMVQLEDALTQMNRFGEPLLDVYHVLSSAQRSRSPSGQTVVQAVQRNADDAEFVAKFYVDRELFHREESLRGNPTFSMLLPPTRQREANGGARLRAPNGCVFPPFVIQHSAVNLSEWCNMEPRTFAVRLEALCAVAQQLCTLHEAGLVHRGLHPRNVLWLQMGEGWRLVDFGHAVQPGRSAQLHVNRPYTPPEATVLEQRGRSDMIAETAADIWALGVITYEVLTGSSVVAPPALREEGDALVKGRAENDPFGLDAAVAVASGAAASSDNHQLLGPLAPTVYSCLSSEPSARPTASTVLFAWQTVLANLNLAQ